MILVQVPKKPTKQKRRVVQMRIKDDLYRAIAKRLPKGASVPLSMARLIEHVMLNETVVFELPPMENPLIDDHPRQAKATA